MTAVTMGPFIVSNIGSDFNDKDDEDGDIVNETSDSDCTR